MLRPSPGDLLAGVADSLQASVLPVLDDGAAQRQLKASLHILRRLARCWDRMPAYLVADNADIAATLQGLGLHDVGEAARALDGTGPLTAVEVNLRLQELLVAADTALRDDARHDEFASSALAALYRRMLDREAHAWGTS